VDIVNILYCSSTTTTTAKNTLAHNSQKNITMRATTIHSVCVPVASVPAARKQRVKATQAVCAGKASCTVARVASANLSSQSSAFSSKTAGLVAQRQFSVAASRNVLIVEAAKESVRE
jgi:hypothetical protein